MRPTYHLTRTNIMYISQWMTVWEDWVSKEGGVAIGMFNRIEVHNAVIVVPILEDSSLLMVENYRHGVGSSLPVLKAIQAFSAGVSPGHTYGFGYSGHRMHIEDD